MTRRTQNQTTVWKETRRVTAAAAPLLTLLLICLICTAPALAGAITVDTAGLTGKVTDTILVPVTITNPGTIVAWQLTAKTGDFENAKIVFNTESVIKAGAASGENLIYWFEASNPDNYIRADKTLFYLAVTPKVEGEIPLEIYDIRVYEAVNGAREKIDYKAVNGTLTVSGIGTGNTVGDSDSGATVIYGVTEHGIYNTGDTNGLSKVELIPPGSASVVNDTTVSVFRGTAGIYEIPQTLKYLSVSDIYIGTKPGDPIRLTFAVPQKELTATGAAIEDIFILHNINGKWYNTTITSKTSTAETVYLAIDTWSTSPFIIVYDTGGIDYPTETKYTATGQSAPQNIPWIIIGIVVAVLAVIIIAVAVIIRRRR